MPLLAEGVVKMAPLSLQDNGRENKLSNKLGINSLEINSPKTCEYFTENKLSKKLEINISLEINSPKIWEYITEKNS